MMNFLSRSPKAVDYTSRTWHESRAISGVRFALKRISLGERLELTRRVREISAKDEFLRSGNEQERMDAQLSELAAQSLIVRWGLLEVVGLRIDGMKATPELLIEKGPEELVHEILAAIEAAAGLSEPERKNS